MQKPAKLFSLYSHSLRGAFFFSVKKGDPSGPVHQKTKNDSNKLTIQNPTLYQNLSFSQASYTWECWVKTSFLFFFAGFPWTRIFWVSLSPPKKWWHKSRKEARSLRCSICFFKRRSLRGQHHALHLWIFPTASQRKKYFFGGPARGNGGQPSNQSTQGHVFGRILWKKWVAPWVFRWFLDS